MTQSGRMDRRQVIGLALATAWRTARGEEREPVAVFAEHPRLLLNAQRLRLLKRERERQSGRWQQFDALVAGNAPLPEPGFACALYSRVAGDRQAGRKAIAWALGPGNDLRQLALVFDWCQDLLSPGEAAALAAKLDRALAQPAAKLTVATARARTLAAIALYDHVPQRPAKELEGLVRDWWDGQMVKALLEGRDAVARDDAYPLFEMLHTVRDTTNVELRDAARQFFKDFPIEHLLTHYPASWPAAENEYRIGASPAGGEPDLRQAALSRAAELAMVAYDVNAASSQVLQGWLMHDRYLLRGTFGVPYEFLWANPYQPGLSYFHVPLVYHNPGFGKLFVRSSWDENAEWFGCWGGTMQLFRQGKVTVLDPQRDREPLALTAATILSGHSARRFRVKLGADEETYVVGLRPHQAYLVEVDSEEAMQAAADRGGILPLDLPQRTEVGVRLKEIGVPVAPARQRDSLDNRNRAPHATPIPDTPQ